MYNVKYVFPMITYITASLTVFSCLLFMAIILVPQIIYAMIALLFIMLLAMSFYLLKNFEIRTLAYNISYPGSIFYS
jgi:hypothetical protein